MTGNYLRAIAIQAIGPTSLLCVSAAVSRWFGPDEQGAFISAKSLADVVIALGCFGFPQSAVLSINRHDVSRRTLYVLTPVYVAVMIPVLMAAAFLLGASRIAGELHLVLISIGSAGCVVVGIWRGILLTIDDGLRFHFVTIVQSTALAIATVAVLASGLSLQDGMPLAYFVTGASALALTYAILPWPAIRGLCGKPPSFSRLVSTGADTFLQNLCGALQVFLCVSWIGLSDEAGYFSMALMVLNALGFPVQAIGPLIFNRWSKQSGSNALNAGRGKFKAIAIGVSILCATAILCAPTLFPLMLGPRFEQGVLPLQIMVAAIFPMFWLRIGSLRLAAAGNFRFMSLVAMARCMLTWFLLPIAGFVWGAGGAAAAGACWLFAESTAAFAVAMKIRALRKAQAS